MPWSRKIVHKHVGQHKLRAMTIISEQNASCRCAVVRRRANHQLARASARLHLVEGFLKAMADLDQAKQPSARVLHQNAP